MDGFHVEPATTARLAGTFADQQPAYEAASHPLRAAMGGFNSGDPGVDGQTRSVVGRVDALVVQFGAIFASMATALNAAAEDYRSGDDQVASSYLELLPEGEESPAEGGGPVSIVDGRSQTGLS